MSAPKSENGNLQHLRSPVGLPVPSRAVWAELATSGNYRDALPGIEIDLAAHSAISAEAVDESTKCLVRLWWVRAQLATDGMPLAALTTPLSEILGELKNLPELEPLAVSNFFLLSEELAKKKQTRLATVFADHTLGLMGARPRAERQALREFAARVYRDEITRAEAKREPDAYLKKLRTRLEELERAEPAERASALPPKKTGTEAATTVALSAKSIREADFSEKNIRDEEELLKAPEPAKEKPPSQVAGFVLGGLFVLFLVAAWEYQFREHGGDDVRLASTAPDAPAPAGQAPHAATPPAAASAPAAAPPPNAPSAAPAAFPAPSAGLQSQAEIGQKLQAIDHNLDTLGERLKNVTFKSMEKAKTVEELSKDPEVDANALKVKEADKLPRPAASPPSTDELASLDNPKKEPPVNPQKIPLLDPKKLDHMTTSEVEPPSNPNSVEPSGKRRESIQPGLPNFGGPPDPNGKTLDGSPLQSYPVERLTNPEVYKTITDTNVLAAPSLLSETIARLPVDTSVQVVSHMGQWLELRSVGGKRGFIYSQNAVPAGDGGKEARSMEHLD